MQRRTRASSAAENSNLSASRSLLSRQLASIADTLAKASRRRDEEVKRGRRTVGVLLGERSVPAHPKELDSPAHLDESTVPGHPKELNASARLRGGADNDQYHTTRLQEWEKAEAVRNERRDFEQKVAGSGPDDPERPQMIKYLLARSQLAKVRAERDVERKRLEAEEEAVDEIDQIIKREQEVDEFEELMLKEEEDMENEDYEERLRLWEEERRLTLRMRAKDAARKTRDAFLIKTNYEGQFKDPEDEKAELLRLEEEIFQHFLAQMQAEDARAVEEERKRQRSEEAEEQARKKARSGSSPGDSAMALSSDEQEDEHSVPPAVHLRGGAFIDAELQEMMAEMQTRVMEREARVRRVEGYPLRQDARTFGHALDKDFKHMVARIEEGELECLRIKQRATQDIQPTSIEAAVGVISASGGGAGRREDADSSGLLEREMRTRCTIYPNETSELKIRGGEASPLDDPTVLLAELRSLGGTVQLSEAENSDTTHNVNDLRQMLAEFDRPSVPVRTSAAAHDDPQQMLTELDMLSAPDHHEFRSPTSEDYDDNEDCDISALRARFERIWESSDRNVSLAPATVVDASASVEPDSIPYIIALELEHSKHAWERAQGWARYLFSSGQDSYESQKAKELAVARAEEALEKTITGVLAAEAQSLRKAEETTLHRRLIVTNLAAGADEEEIERQFWKYRHDITRITFLPDRDPMRRTHTAHVDFSSRKAAVEASFIAGQVYGLIFSVELTLPVEYVPSE